MGLGQFTDCRLTSVLVPVETGVKGILYTHKPFTTEFQQELLRLSSPMNEMVFYVPINALLGYIGTVTSLSLSLKIIHGLQLMSMSLIIK